MNLQLRQKITLPMPALSVTRALSESASTQGLVCEGCDQLVARGDVLVGNDVALVRLFLCDKEISLNKNQGFWLKFADVGDHLFVALKKALRWSDYTWDQVHIKAQYYPIWKEFLLRHAIQTGKKFIPKEAKE